MIASSKAPRLSWGLALLFAHVFLPSPLLPSQDVHVHISPQSHGTTASTDDFPTIQMALDHAPLPGPTGRLYLHIAHGTYAERVMVTQNRPRTTFLGDPEDPAAVVITASQNAKSAGGTFFSSTVVVNGDGFQADGITFQNAAGNTGQAVALTVRADRVLFKHCRFLGDQDTLFTDYGRQFYLQSYIEGGVDFIFGNSTAVFLDMEIHVLRPGYITAQSRTAPTQTTGFVFWNAKITSNSPFYLGRPWRPYARVLFLSSDLPATLNPLGWSPWTKDGNIATTFYAESNNRGPGSSTQSRMPGSHLLTDTQPYQPNTFLSGADHWNPTQEAATLP